MHPLGPHRFLRQPAVPKMQTLNMRVGAARVALENSNGTPNHKNISTTQAAAVVSELKGVAFTPGEKADFSAKVVELKWATQQDLDIVLECLTPGPCTPSAKRRRSQQDFRSVHLYGDETFWDALTSTSMGSAAKLQLLLQLAMRLGLRLPSEHSLKWLTSLWLFATNSEEDLIRMDAVGKAVFLKHTKNVMDGFRRTASDPFSWVHTLPGDPVEYLRDFPTLFKAAYGENKVPGPCRFDLSAVLAFDQSYGCRGSSRVVPLGRPSLTLVGGAVPSASTLSMSPRRGEATALSAMAGQFMTQMQQMAANQHRLMEMMLGGVPASGGGRPMRSLSALEDRRDVGTLALPALQPATPCGGVLVEELPETPEPKAVLSRAPVAHAGPEDQVVDAGPSSAATGTTPPSGCGAAKSLDDMLDAFNQRKVESALRRADAKKAAVAEVPGAKKAPPKTKASAKKLSKMKAEAVAKKVCLVEEAVAETVSAKTLVAVGTKPVSAKTKVPAKKVAKAAAKKKVGDDDALVLGCSKCRWSLGGCGQCQNPAFKGARWNPTVER